MTVRKLYKRPQKDNIRIRCALLLVFAISHYLSFSQKEKYDSVKMYGIQIYSIPHIRASEYYLMDFGDSLVIRDRKVVNELFNGIVAIANSSPKRELRQIRKKFSVNEIDARGYFIFSSKDGNAEICLSSSMIRMQNQLFVCDVEKLKKLICGISEKLCSVFW